MGRQCRLRAAAVAVSLLFVLLFVTGAIHAAPRALTLEERIAAQKAIEEVYWRHRIWPSDNADAKPAFSMSDDVLRAKVERYLQESAALEKFWGRPLTAAQLQAEIDRMVAATRDGAMLAEIFTALRDDPAQIAECVARPALADRLIRSWYANDERFQGNVRLTARQAIAGRHSAAHAVDEWELCEADLAARRGRFADRASSG